MFRCTDSQRMVVNRLIGSRRPCRFLVILVLLISFGEARGEGASEATRVNMDQAVERALKRSAASAAARHAVAATEARRKSARGAFLPLLSVEAGLQIWDRAMESPFDVSGVPAEFQPLVAGFDTGPLREQVTFQTTVSIAQPLTPLYGIYQGYKAAKLARDAATHDLRARNQDAVFTTQRGYIQLKRALAGLEIAESSLVLLDAQLARTKALVKAGVVENNDLLKVEVARARVQEGVISARAGATLAETALALAMGLGGEQRLNLTEAFADPPPAFDLSFGEALAIAYRKRPELAGLRAQVARAEAGKGAAVSAMIPSLVAMAAYQFTEGQGSFSQKHAFFGGATLKWDFWNWGKDYYAYEEAGARVKQAGMGIRQLRDGILLQVRKAYLDLTSAKQRIVVAKVSIRQAEEAYRVEKLKFEKNASTTTDLLNAETVLTTAKQSYSDALYGWYLARVEIKRSMGTVQKVNR
jgi:outer membrane protein